MDSDMVSNTFLVGSTDLLIYLFGDLYYMQLMEVYECLYLTMIVPISSQTSRSLATGECP